MTSKGIMLRQRAAVGSHIFGVLNRSILVALKSDALTVFRVKMSSRFQIFVCAVLAFAPAWLPVSAVAQQDLDPEMRIERLENQLRTLTGQNEELQYRNRQLEEQLRALQGAQPQPGQVAAPRPVAPNVAVAPQPGYQPNPGYQPPPATGPAPAVIAGACRQQRPPRRCLRSKPESERAGRAACTGRRAGTFVRRSGRCAGRT